MATLYGLRYSGWTEKACWALDHHGVRHRYVEHVVMLGEPVLRFAARRPFGRVTVPLFVDAGARFEDSLDIARHAERVGRGAPLFDAAHDESITRWNAISERMLSAGRARLVPRVLGDDTAMHEALPPWVPASAAGAMIPVARRAVRFLAGKHGVDPQGADALHRATLVEGLTMLREALTRGDHVLGGDAFTYADIAMAASLQGVRPVADRYLVMGPATRRCWSDESLAEEFADVVAWRDRTYDAHRGTP